MANSSPRSLSSPTTSSTTTISSSSSTTTTTIMEPGVLAAMEKVRSGATKGELSLDVRHCIDYNDLTNQMHMVEQQINRQMGGQQPENQDNDDDAEGNDENHEQEEEDEESEEQQQQQEQEQRDHHAMMLMMMQEQRERTRPRRLDCAHVQQIVQFLKEHNNTSSDDDDDDDNNNKEESSSSSNNNNTVTSLSIRQYLLSGDDEDNVKALDTLRDYFVQSKRDDDSENTGVITTVNLSFCKFGNSGANRLVPAFHNTHVTSLSWPGNDISGDEDDGDDALEQLLTENGALCQLKLADNHRLGVTGAAGLGRGLSRNAALENLNLTYCKIGSAGVALLLPPPLEDEENEVSTTPASITNDSLMDLDLSWNEIIGEEGGENLGNLLPRLTQLQRLNMTMNALGSPGAKAMGPGLALHETLQKLVLSNCDLGSEGVGNLIPSGQSNSSVKHLVLERNGIEGQEGGANLAAVVQRFQKLKKLSLQGNPLGPDGAKAFALGLQPQSQGAGSTRSIFFELLDMSECQLGDDGVAWMAKACIGRLDNVRHWNIFRNDITSRGLDVLTRHVLKVVHRLEVLDIFCNPQLLQDLSVVATLCDTLTSMTHDTTAAMHTNTTSPCLLRQLDMRGCITRTTNDGDDDEEQEALFTAVETKLVSACQRNSTLTMMAMAMNANNRERLNENLKRNSFLMHANTMAQKAAASLTDDDKQTAVSPHVLYWAWNEIRQCDQGASAAFHLFRNVLLCPP